MDFIFIIGAPAVGKTTLAKELYKKLGGVYIEQNAVPEFEIPPYVRTKGSMRSRSAGDVCFVRRSISVDWGCII